MDYFLAYLFSRNYCIQCVGDGYFLWGAVSMNKSPVST